MLKSQFKILIINDSPEDLQTYCRCLDRDLTTADDLHVASYAKAVLEFCQTT